MQAAPLQPGAAQCAARGARGTDDRLSSPRQGRAGSGSPCLDPVTIPHGLEQLEPLKRDGPLSNFACFGFDCNLRHYTTRRTSGPRSLCTAWLQCWTVWRCTMQLLLMQLPTLLVVPYTASTFSAQLQQLCTRNRSTRPSYTL